MAAFDGTLICALSHKQGLVLIGCGAEIIVWGIWSVEPVVQTDNECWPTDNQCWPTTQTWLPVYRDVHVHVIHRK